MEPSQRVSLAVIEPDREIKKEIKRLSLNVTLLPDDNYALLNTVYVSENVFQSWPKQKGEAWCQIGRYVYQILKADYLQDTDIGLNATQRRDLNGSQKVVIKDMKKPTHVFEEVIFEVSGRVPSDEKGRVYLPTMEQIYKSNVISVGQHLNMQQIDRRWYTLSLTEAKPYSEFGVIDNQTVVTINLRNCVYATKAEEIEEFVFSVAPSSENTQVPVLFSPKDFAQPLLQYRQCKWLGQPERYGINECFFTLVRVILKNGKTINVDNTTVFECTPLSKMKFEFFKTSIIQVRESVTADRLELELLFCWKETDKEVQHPNIDTLIGKLRSGEMTTFYVGQHFCIKDEECRYYCTVKRGQKSGIEDDRREKIGWQIGSNTQIVLSSRALELYVCDKQAPKLLEVTLGVFIMDKNKQPIDPKLASRTFETNSRLWLDKIKREWLQPSKEPYYNSRLRIEYQLYLYFNERGYAKLIDYKVEKDKKGTEFPSGSPILGRIDENTNYIIKLVEPQVPNRDVKYEVEVEVQGPSILQVLRQGIEFPAPDGNTKKRKLE